MSDSTKRNRRWFQFSLRSLMIAVTLIAVPLSYVAHEYRIVAARKSLQELPGFEFVCEEEPEDGMRTIDDPIERVDSVSWLRRRFGDKMYAIVVISAASDVEVDRLKGLFPESTIIDRRH